MKKAALNWISLIVSVIIAGVFNTCLVAQSVPGGINYQAVARDVNGDELINRSIDIRLSIISGSPAGDPATDDQVLSYDPQSYILSLENDDNPVDLSGLINDADADPDNELQILNLTGNTLQIKTLSDSTLINTVDIDASTVNEIQNLSIQGHQLSLSLGNSVSLPDSVNDDDADPLNEIQDLHIEGNVLYITRNSDSTRIDLSPYLDNTDEQDLSLTKNILSIVNGNSVTLNYNDTSSTNELQVLSISNDTIYLSSGGYIKLPQDNVNDADTDPANEIQDLSLTDNTLKVTNNPAATDIDLSGYLDNTDHQVLTISNDSIYLSSGGYVKLPQDNVDDADPDPVNELIASVDFDENSNLNITDAGGTTTVDLSSLENIPLIGFRAEKNSENSLPGIGTDTTMIFNENILYNSSSSYNGATGTFTAPVEGTYIFYINFNASNDGGGQTLKIFKENNLFEILKKDILSGEIVSISIPIRLNSGDTIKTVLNSGMSTNCGTGSFTGFRIH
ncbi:hypothetical protein ES705_16330 [subsurface metagenome]